MKTLIGKEIADEIFKCTPEFIAVAYIGNDWRKFIQDPKKLKCVVISPTLGTNPYAVSDLVKKIGWDKVEFLDELHAKFYIGKDMVVSGSANLTNNGLSGHGLYELCNVISNTEYLKKCRDYFDILKSKAMDSYMTTDAKKERLEELYSLWGKAFANGFVVSKQSDTKFEDFELLTNNHFYVSWYQNAECEHSPDIEIIRDSIASDTHFLPTDNIQKNKWVLMWQKTNGDRVDKRVKPSWLYIHELFENGILDKDYEHTTVAIERNDIKKPDEPFILTPEVIEALRLALENETNSKYFIQSDRELYDTNFAQQNLSALINDMRAILKNAS